jgi:CRISPR-associated protein Cas1
MKKLLNTLFVTLEDGYAALDGENVVIKQGETVVRRFPLHILERIFLFSYSGASPALMGKCAKAGVDLVFLTPRGRFLARTCGESRGNVLLRRTQYRVADDPSQSCRIARNFIFGKLNNARQVLDRTRRDHAMRIDEEKFQTASQQLKDLMAQVLEEFSLDGLRGLEGAGATIYFGLFDDMILRNKEVFFFRTRNRRPPLDNVNALLSYVYTLLGTDCAAALEAVGLDAYVGFLHRDRPGRTSLALDLLEELRPCLADRFVLTLINNGVITADDFEPQESGAVWLSKDGCHKVNREWQTRKQQKITHPFLKEQVEWGMVPYVQALLLARCLRDDLDEYPPFLWK